MWQELPSRWSYLAMKVRLTPSWAAISFAPSLKRLCSSHFSTSVSYLKATSCWPKLHSPFTDSTTMPAERIERRIRPSSGSMREVPWIE